MLTFLLLFCFTASLLAATPGYYPETANLVFVPDTDSLIFSDKPVARGSVTVQQHNRLLIREEEYRVDYNRRLIFRLAVRTEPETLAVRFEKSSFDFHPIYFHRRPDTSNTSSAALLKESSPLISETREENTLFLAGSKTLGITLGNGAMTVDQSLDLNIHGEVAPGVQVRAILTDQNLPFQPEGNTESIRELDRVLVEIETKRLLGSLGDLVLSQEGSRFGDFQRRIKGAKTDYHDEQYHASAAVAVSEGLFHSIEIPGQESNQGPYRLVNRSGIPGIIVLAGTERVFVDGHRKKRGQNNDYVIEYGNGQITFTPNCLITADNLIRVEYEFTENEYTRNILSAGGDARLLDGKLKFSAGVLSEADDRSHPISISLSSSDQDSLKQAGDLRPAMGSGVTLLSRDSVNIYRGFYIITNDLNFPDSHYVYHPPRDTILFNGITTPFYSVSFQYTGSGKGDYLLDSLRDSTDPGLSGTYAAYRDIYIYKGRGQGSYLPGDVLPKPESHRLGILRYDFESGPDFVFHGEAAGSRRDLNTFSSLDDADNQGGAAAHSFSATLGRYLSEGGKGRFVLAGRHEFIQKSFTPFSPIQNNFLFRKKWGLSLPATNYRLNNGEGGLTYSPHPALSLETNGGFLFLNDNRSSRLQTGVLWAIRSSHKLQMQEEYTEANRADTMLTMARTTGSAEKIIGIFIPRADFLGEFQRETEAGRLLKRNTTQEYGAGLSAGKPGALFGQSALRFRLDQVSRENSPDALLDSARSWTLDNRASWSGPSDLEIEAQMANRRSRRLETGNWRSFRSDAAILTADVRPLDGALDQRVRYDLSSTLSQTQVERYAVVPAGTGTHTRDPLTGDYIPKDGGDYIYLGTVADKNSSGENVNTLEISYRLFFYPGKLTALDKDSGFLKDLSFDTYLFLAQDKFSNIGLSFAQAYLPDFNPNRVQGSKSSRYEFNFREEIALNNPLRNLFIRLRLNPHFRSNYPRMSDGSFGTDATTSWTYKLLSRFTPLSPVSVEDELTLEWISRDRGGSAPLYDLLNRESENTVTCELSRTLSLPLGLTGGYSENRTPDSTLSVPYFGFEPGLVLTFPAKGKFEVRYGFFRVITHEPYLFYEMAQGHSPGTSHQIEALSGFRLGKNMDLDLSYHWEKNQQDTKPIQRGSARLKAFF